MEKGYPKLLMTAQIQQFPGKWVTSLEKIWRRSG